MTSTLLPSPVPRRTPPRYRPAWPGEVLVRLLRDPLSYFTDIAAVHGDVVQLRGDRENAYLVSHPDLIRDVLVTNQRFFKKGRALERARLLLGDGLLTSEGDVHRRQRRMIQPEFHRQQVAGFAETMMSFTARRVARWQDGATLDVHAEMHALTLAIAGDTFFGGTVEHEAAEIAQALDETFSTFMRTFYLPWGDLLLRLPLPSTRRFWAGTRRLEATVSRLIQARRHSVSDRNDLLSLLLRARDEEGDGSGMTDQQVRDEVITFFIAGHETTANALTWSLYLLARHPEVADRVAAEARALGTRPLEAGDLGALPYARQVVSEAMRLFPPAWAVARRALTDVVVGDYTVEAGSLVIMSQWVVHRDARWWSVPERFDPDRWGADPGQRPKFAYFPFGGGARVCIGEHFAWMEAILVLASVVRDWSFTVAPDARVELQPSITLRPKHGIHLQLQRRP